MPLLRGLNQDNGPNASRLAHVNTVNYAPQAKFVESSGPGRRGNGAGLAEKVRLERKSASRTEKQIRAKTNDLMPMEDDSYDDKQVV